MPRRYNAVADWFDAASTANAVAFTIGMRMFGMQKSLQAGTFFSDPENYRMVAEKAEAASMGAFEAATEWNRLWWRTAAGQGATDVAAAIAAGARVAKAASRPAVKKVRANASRLRRR